MFERDFTPLIGTILHASGILGYDLAMSRKRFKAIGLMSGTSLDGIDVALLTSDGEYLLEHGPSLSVEYEGAFRERLKEALTNASAIKSRTDRPGNLHQVEQEMTERHASAVSHFLNINQIPSSEIDLIGFHGQTILHRPEDALTVQLGDGEFLAKKTGIPVVYDMRANDMAHGGQGAPLAPVYHRALVANSGLKESCAAIVNIGGISNATVILPDGEIHAFDCGPGNVLIDQWIETHTGAKFDVGGEISSSGTLVPQIAERYLDDIKKLVKDGRSLDRLDFKPLQMREASLPDGARTLCHITSKMIAESLAHLPAKPSTMVLTGGGRLNAAIVQELEQILPDCKIAQAEDFNMSGDSIEAEAWAYLAIRAKLGLPLTFPSTTGVNLPISGGLFAEPSNSKNV